MAVSDRPLSCATAVQVGRGTCRCQVFAVDERACVAVCFGCGCTQTEGSRSSSGSSSSLQPRRVVYAPWNSSGQQRVTVKSHARVLRIRPQPKTGILQFIKTARFRFLTACPSPLLRNWSLGLGLLLLRSSRNRLHLQTYRRSPFLWSPCAEMPKMANLQQSPFPALAPAPSPWRF